MSLAPQQAAPAKHPVKIMELGDSITAGVDAGGAADPNAGYRSRLAGLLQSGQYEFTMVGSRVDYSEHFAYPQHEGWPGYVLRSFPSKPAGQLYGALIHSAVTRYHPDILLLMAGTNDLLRLQEGYAGYTLPNIERSMDLVLGQIFALDPRVTVIVAGVVDSPKVAQRTVYAFDEDPRHGLVAIVNAYRARGFSIQLAPGMGRAVPRNATYFPDGIHPSGADGYDRVAQVWYGALERVLVRGSVVVSDKQAKP